MNTKIPLPQDMLNELIAALENCDVEQDNERVFEEKTSFITVDDYDGEAVSASWGFFEDGPRSSAPTPDIHYSIIASGLKFTAVQHYDEIGEWQMLSDEYFILADKWDEIQGLLDDAVDKVDSYDGAYYPTCLSEEWSEEEVTEAILSLLEHEQYIEFEDKIYPLPGSVQDFIDDYNTEHETNIVLDENDYTLLPPQEVAERLTEEIYD